jgi:hypothetical protein
LGLRLTTHARQRRHAISTREGPARVASSLLHPAIDDGPIAVQIAQRDRVALGF